MLPQDPQAILAYDSASSRGAGGEGNTPIQGLWIGSHVPTMQCLSICSFLAAGHSYHLYSYGRLNGVPRGAVLMDANEIIPKAMVFKNARANTYAAFSDLFRYKLLLMRGGWWADLDMVCLQPFSFADEYVFSSEHVPGGGGAEEINCGVMRVPSMCEAMQYMWQVCLAKDYNMLTWSELGPSLTAEAVYRYHLVRYVRPASAFCPIPMNAFRSIVDPAHRFDFLPSTFSIHLWHEFWRRVGLDVDANFPADCLYERLKARFMIA